MEPNHNSKEWYEGWGARMADENATCPYEEGTQQHTDWVEGFTMCDAELEC